MNPPNMNWNMLSQSPQSDTSTFSQFTKPSIRIPPSKSMSFVLRAKQLRKEIVNARPESGKVKNPAVDKGYKCHVESSFLLLRIRSRLL